MAKNQKTLKEPEIGLVEVNGDDAEADDGTDEATATGEIQVVKPPERENVERERGADVEDLVASYLADISKHDLLTKDDEIELAQLIEEGREARDELDSGAKHTPRRRTELRRQVHAGEKAQERFINANLRLVVSVAKKYGAASGMELLDLIQEGNFGLMRAGEVRLAPRVQVLHVRHLVDPPGRDPWDGQQQPHDPPAGPRRRPRVPRRQGALGDRGSHCAQGDARRGRRSDGPVHRPGDGRDVAADEPHVVEPVHR